MSNIQNEFDKNVAEFWGNDRKRITELEKERADLLAKLAQLEALQRHHDLCRKALDVPENEPLLDAIEALLKSARGLLEQAGYLEWDPKTLRLTKGGCEK